MENIEQPQKKVTNPLLAKKNARLPGTVFRLPSRGIFYENTNILSDDSVDGEVLIYPMRLRDELRMKALDSIFQGTAVTETISYCVPQINEPENLVAEDVDYILTVIKKLTHGNLITYKDVCFKLDDADEETRAKITEQMAKSEMDDSAREKEYALNDKIREKIQDGEEFSIDLLELEEQKLQDRKAEENVTEITSGLCEFQIPVDHFINSCKPVNPDTAVESLTFMFENFEIETRPITFDQFKDISTMRLADQQSMSNEQFSNFVTDFSNKNLMARIKRIDETTDPALIAEWVESLSMKEREAIFKKIEESLNWGIDFSYEVECPKCGKKKMTDQSYLNPMYFFLTS